MDVFHTVVYGGGLRAAVRKDEKNVGNTENSLTLIECKR